MVKPVKSGEKLYNLPSLLQIVPTKAEHAYQKLRELIVSGFLPAGSAINQDQLSIDLGVSTTPIREALRRLSAENFVVIDAHRDTRVAELSATEARDLLEVRTALETLSIELACERASTEDLANLEILFSQISRRDYRLTDAALLAHRKFHHAIQLASQNKAIHASLVRIYDQCDRYVRFGIENSKKSADITDDYNEHLQFIEFIRNRDVASATALMRSHVKNSLLSYALDHLTNKKIS